METIFQLDNSHEIRILFLQFDRPYHGVTLAGHFAELPGIEHANANSIGGDGDDIEVEDNVYTLFQRWGDCMAGCTGERSWTFRVDGPNVQLVAQHGSPREFENLWFVSQPFSASDVNVDGHVTPLDALLIIHELQNPTTPSIAEYPNRFDVDCDGQVTRADVEHVIADLDVSTDERPDRETNLRNRPPKRGLPAVIEELSADQVFASADW